MKLTHIAVRNILGVSAAEIRLDKPVTLIAGKNFAGKSSVQESVRMALTGETVRADLKKDYGRLVREGESSGLVEVGIAGAATAWFSLPDGKSAPLTDYVPPKAMPYLLDAQRFARIPENDRRAFLFGLMGLSADGPAVRQRLEAKGCDAKKIEAIMPILRAGFAAACEDAKGKATAAKGAWRAVTGETYGAKKAAGWKAAKPAHDAALLAETRSALVRTEIEIEAATTRLGDLQGQARSSAEQKARLSELREKAGHFARIQEKLNRDEAELRQWQEKVKETRQKAGAVPAESPMTCPHCGGSVVHRSNSNGPELWPYEQPAIDQEAIDKLPEYERALTLMQSAVANGTRDLAAADSAAKALRELEDAGLIGPPADDELTRATELLAKLKHERSNYQAGIRMAEESARAAAVADKKTADAGQHHADVEAWTLIGDALAPDGIPGDMLSEALQPINARLAQSAADSGWLTVEIDADMGIHTSVDTAEPGVFHARPYALLSESEKWRVDAMLAEAIANLSGLKLLVLDRFDVLDLQGRADLLVWLEILATNGELDTALIFGTLKALPAELPASIAAHWIENGVVGKLREAA